MKFGQKIALVAAAVLTTGSNLMAAVTYDDASSSFTGAIETSPFISAVVVAITLTGLMVAVKAGVSAIKSA